jgi:protein-S-isoprenylcysteine O-methyltransferase Ste14
MLTDEFEKQGVWLFRWRSYVPLLLAPLAIWVISRHEVYLADSSGIDFAFKLFCLMISLVGLAIRFLVHGYALEGTSGRNTRKQVARNLNTQALYSVVRHPLYLGNIIMMLGIMLFTHSILLCAAGLFGYLLFYERIMATEEPFLFGEFGESYREWAARTPALLPRWSQWIQPGYPFSWKRAIRGEFYGLLAIIASMTFLDTLDRWVIEHVFRVRPFWLILLVLATVLFLVLRYLRKHTQVLEGRRTARVSVKT